MIRKDEWPSYRTVLPAILRLLHIDLSTIEVRSVQIQRLPDGAVGNIHKRHAFVTSSTHSYL